MSGHIERKEGRRLFGLDPVAYDCARPGHAPGVYAILVERCGLAGGIRVLEVGPGTGQATRRLLDHGAHLLVALEPDAALAAFLETTLRDRIEVVVTALEDAELPAASFDLAVAASSFHWVEEDRGLAKLLEALRPGAWVALWWTLFGEPGKPDAFIEATSPLLENLKASPTYPATPDRPPHALDAEARLEGLRTAGFERAEHEVMRWEARWGTAGIRALYGTFSPIARLDEAHRNEILDGIADIAERDFGGHVERTLITSLYMARRPE